MSQLTHKDAESYATSNYWVMLPDGVLFLRPWVANISISDLHKNFNVRTSAIISPCNPQGKKLSNGANQSLMNAFEKDAGKKWKLLPCGGSALGGKRRSEKS